MKNPGCLAQPRCQDAIFLAHGWSWIAACHPNVFSPPQNGESCPQWLTPPAPLRCPARGQFETLVKKMGDLGNYLESKSPQGIIACGILQGFWPVLFWGAHFEQDKRYLTCSTCFLGGLCQIGGGPPPFWPKVLKRLESGTLQHVKLA